ncbi:MAG: type VI secretion system ImpA family N-terminal domain-containing protein, partial [Myxococcales bacterium]|nr:type VI secretion system ImpA family N-terminal domain-containing protein [Myxococcales bacterium]
MDRKTLEQRIAVLLAPVSAANPGGENATYDPRHEELRREVAKLESPTTDMPDWASVAKTGSALLRDASKDYLMAAYVAWAWFETEGLDGLAYGVALLHGIVERYWDDGFPPLKRIRGRSNAFDWFMGRLDNAMAGITVTGKDRIAITLLEDLSPAFASLVRDKFEDKAPGMRTLTEGVKRLQMSLPEASAEELAAVAAAVAKEEAAAPEPEPAPT